MRKINSSKEKTPKKTNLLNLNTGLIDKVSSQIINNFKRMLSDIIKFHKGPGKNKNYTLEFNSTTGEYKLFYKGKSFASVTYDFDTETKSISYKVDADSYIIEKLNNQNYVSEI